MRVQDVVNMNTKLVPKQSIIVTIIVILLVNVSIQFSYVMAARIGVSISLLFAFFFFNLKNRIIFNAIKSLHEDRIPIDIISVKNQYPLTFNIVSYRKYICKFT